MHNFIYSLRILFKNKILIFWTFAFPILLGTFFYMAFSNIEDSEKLDRISIAIVENEAFENRQIVKEAFEALSDEEGLFNTIYVEEKKEAERCLANDEIIGYLFVEEEPKIVVKTSGINQTILKATMEEILQMESIIQVKIEKRMQESLEQGIAFDLTQDFFKQMAMDIRNAFEEEVSIKDISSSHLSYTMIEFYTLIAMACLYGGILGMTSINQILPNMSHTGKRISISPASKGKLILSSVCASFVTQLLGIFLLFLYTIFVLKVDYGTNLPLIVLLSLTGSLAGLSLGIAVATLIKANENAKIGILIAVTMLGCFLSGMMGITMKYMIDKNVPIVNLVNPASMITDGFYALYYYDTLDRYFLNIVSLLIFSGVMIILSINGLRKQKYEAL